MDAFLQSKIEEACTRIGVDSVSVGPWVVCRLPDTASSQIVKNGGVSSIQYAGIPEKIPYGTRLPFPRFGVLIVSLVPDSLQIASISLFVSVIDEHSFSVGATSRAHPTLVEVVFSETESGFSERAPVVPTNEVAKSLVEGIRTHMRFFVSMLYREGVKAHIPTGHPANAKRIRKGKKPFIVWTTVDIVPPTPRIDPLGGHHASPRLHERRGHYRTYKSGKRVWVRNCMVGRATEGIGFHDYRVQYGTA